MYYNNRKLILSICWMILGFVLILLSVLDIVDSTMYSGMGGGLLGVGLMQVVRNLKYRKDPEYKEKIDVEANDERIRYNRMKAWAYVGFISFFVYALGGLFCYITGKSPLGQILSVSMYVLLALYWVCYLIISKKG